jgi:hypothetical protein
MAWSPSTLWTYLLSVYYRSSKATGAILVTNSGNEVFHSVEALERESTAENTPAAIYAMITCFLDRCGLYYPEGNLDNDFIAKCRQEATHRGYIMEGPTALDKWILPSAIMAT